MSDPCRYFIPGPVWVRSEVLAEMTRPMVGHRSGEFRAVMARIFPDLKALFRTTQHAFVASCSGTGLLEAAIVNCVPRSVLVTTCGAFSERWYSIANRLGLEVDRLELEWGQAVDPVRLADHLASRRHRYDAVTITHNETSTGVINDVEALARVVREHSSDTLVLVDAVSSLASAPLEFDAWGLDVCVASSQKGIGVPPGAAVFAVSEHAMERSASEKFKGMYFDFLEFRKHFDESGNVPYTPAVPVYYALAAQLEHILRAEGLEARWARHRAMRDAVLAKTAAHADPLASNGHESPSVTTLVPKHGRSPRAIVDSMKSRGFTVSGGYGRIKDDTFRIGHMGDLTLTDVETMLAALEEVFDESR
ncbi:MAG: alanine--glyoxylate aminotransferase family protein [Acidobacteria bacterium]|nr:alanine--glyoxylate aminotransferase family protein [Acidobacteriota bacterium]